MYGGVWTEGGFGVGAKNGGGKYLLVQADGVAGRDGYDLWAAGEDGGTDLRVWLCWVRLGRVGLQYASLFCVGWG
jgi:hypothetical protein